MTQQFIIPPRTTDGNEIRKFFNRVCQLINGTLETKNSLARIYLASNYNLTDNTPATVPFDTVSYDIGSNWDAVNFKYICQVAGYYHVSWNLLVAVSGDHLGYVWTALNKNAGAVAFGSGIQGNALHTLVYCAGVTDVQCAVADTLYVQVNADVDSGTPYIYGGTAYNHLSVHLIST